jgi:hypothetical protein
VEVSGGCNGRGATKPTTTRSGDVGRATADHYVVDGTQYVGHCAKHCVAVMLKCHLYAGIPPCVRQLVDRGCNLESGKPPCRWRRASCAAIYVQCLDRFDFVLQTVLTLLCMKRRADSCAECSTIALCRAWQETLGVQVGELVYVPG